MPYLETEKMVNRTKNRYEKMKKADVFKIYENDKALAYNISPYIEGEKKRMESL